MGTIGKHGGKGVLLIQFFISVLLLFVLLFPSLAEAANTDQKVVRVGYVNVSSYEEGGEGEYKRGAGYEYLQKISYLTGWKYEYVYGSFKECFQWLAEGKIDLFGNMSYTPERAGLFLFSSYPQGKDTYWIYTVKGRTDLSDGNIESLTGCRIGVTDGSYQEGLLRDWLAKNHIQAEIVTCQGYDEQMRRLNQGELDCIAAPDLSNSYNYTALANIGFSDYYFAVSNTRPDLLKELNGALFEIQTSETDYNSRLAARYYSRMASGMVLNQPEKQWLADHQNTIRLGYLVDNLPFSGNRDGKMVGVLATVVEQMEKNMDVRVETVPFNTVDEMKWSLKQEKIDVAGPAISDFYLAELDDLVLTHDIVQTTPVLIYQGTDYAERQQVIAVTSASIITPEAISILYPGAQLYYCNSRNECLQAVADGKATGTIIPSSRLNIISANPLFKKLSVAEIAHRTEVALLVTKNNRRVATIMNKAISLSSDILNGMVMAQHSAPPSQVSIREFISNHAASFVAIASAIIILLSVLLYKLTASRKKMELALEETQRANDANTAKTIFLSNMSHDIRTPMNAIIGMTVLMEHELHNPDKLDFYIHKLQNSSQYLLSLINNVLDMSKIESSDVKLNRAPLSLADQVSQVDSIIRPEAEGKKQKFQIRIHGISHEYLLGDAVRLRQVLVNLLSNAVKYTPVGGQISLDIEELNPITNDQADFRIIVADSGYGMTPEFLKHIFEPFTRAENSMTNKIQGTGLGMAITKNIVEMMGGMISVESHQGKGSRFTLLLSFGIDKKIKKELATKRILLLTQDDALAHNATLAMKGTDTIFDVAYGDNEVQTILEETSDLQKTPVDLVLVGDGKQGEALLKELQLIREKAKKAIVIYCCDRMNQDKVRGLVTSGEVDGLLVRPFFLSNLNQAIERIRNTIKEEENTSILQGMRFLCAEDNELNAEILEAILDIHGATCRIYPNGKELVDAFLSVKPGDYDAILMDMQMPVMNGLEATKAIRKSANPLGKTIPIIAMTANAFAEDVQQCLAAGMDAHVAKPLEMSVFEKTLHHLKKRM